MSSPRRRYRGRRQPVSRRIRVYRILGLVAVIGLAAAAIWGRCIQMERAADRAMASGLQAMAETLRHRESSFEDAEHYFVEAAQESPREAFPRFCLSALRELRGERAVRQAPPPGWYDAITSLARANLETAKEAFEGLQSSPPPYSFRAAMYLRLIDELRPYFDE